MVIRLEDHFVTPNTSARKQGGGVSCSPLSSLILYQTSRIVDSNEEGWLAPLLYVVCRLVHTDPKSILIARKCPLMGVGPYAQRYIYEIFHTSKDFFFIVIYLN